MKKQIVEGPFGIKTTEETARYLEGLIRNAPKGKEYAPRVKNTLTESTFEIGERASVDVVTTDSVDKEYEVVLPNGMDLEPYRKNPIVLFGHDQEKPIGRSLWIKPSGNGIKSKTLYATRPKDYVGDWLPDMVFALVQQDVLKGRSIGFFPLQIDPPSQEQIKSRPDWSKANAIISKSVIFEYSIVSVPCNNDALTEMVAKKLKGFSLKSLQALGLMQTVSAKPKARMSDEALLLSMLDQIQINPQRIAEKVIDAMKNRGRV